MDLGILSIEVSSICNEKCIHCFHPHAKLNRPKFAEDLNFLDKIFGEFAKKGFLYLILTGGEPLLNPKFLDIFRLAKKHRYSVTLKTNGLLLTEEIAKELKKGGITKAEISLYYPSEKHDEITLIKNSFKQSLKAIEILKKYKILTRINNPLLSPLENLGKMDILTKGFNASWLPSPLLFPTQDLREEIEKLRLTKKELFEYLTFKLNNSDFEFSKIANFAKTGNICGMGRKTIYINTAGEYFYCTFFPKTAGSLYEISVEDMFEKNEKVRKEIEENRECKNCELLPFCNPCPAVSLLETGSMSKCSPSRKTLALQTKEFYYKNLNKYLKEVDFRNGQKTDNKKS